VRGGWPQVAAVVGRTFPVRVLERVAAQDGQDGQDGFERDLSVLLRAQCVREVSRYPELVYAFKHGLLREAALSTLTPTRREELYERVAVVFDDLYAASRDEHLELLAYYYARSPNLEKALEYLEQAGARAASPRPRASLSRGLRRRRWCNDERESTPTARARDWRVVPNRL